MVHPWPVFTPDVNYDTLALSGAGPGSTVAAAGAHGQLAATLESVVGASSANAAGTYGLAWSGAGSAAAAGAHVGMNGETSALAAAAASKVGPLMAAAQAHPTAVAAMYPSAVVRANRINEHADQLINPLVWGALTPEIVALNLHYGHMWATNAAAGAGYGVALRTAAAALVVPAVPAVSGASPAAGAAAAASLGATAGLAGAQAGLAGAEQGAMAVISPATATPAAAVGVVSALAATTTTAPATGTASAPQAQPLAAVQVTAPAVPAPSQAPVPATSGMFAAPPTAALITAPVPPTTATPQVGAPTIAPPAAAPGLSSFIKPTDPFAAPPIAGRAATLAPGMLNAAALRGPISTMPLTTTATTPSTAARPMANVQVLEPPPQPTPSGHPLLQPGTVETLQPPPQSSPPTNPPAHLLTPPPVPQSGPQPSAGPNGPAANGTGVQMLGSGPGGAPQAPPTPLPLNPSPPVPPPPGPGEPPLLPPQIPSWVTPPVPKSVQAAQKAYQDLIKDIEIHNSWRPDPHNWDQVNAYNQEAWTYNTWKSDLEQQLNGSKTEYTPANEAVRTDIPSWTQPAPKTTQPPTVSQGPGHWGPSGENFQGFSKQYQEFVTGHPISDAYFVNGTKFDDFADGALIDAKGDFGQFLLLNGDWKSFFPGDANFLSQAFRQTEAAGQIPIHWVFAQEQVAEKVAALLEANGYTNITVIWQPMG